MSRVSIPTLIIAGLVVLILLAAICTYQVEFYETVVRVRLGRADESSVVSSPGLKLRWPAPIEQIRKYDTRLQTLDTPETEIKTSDGKNVIVGAYVVWKIDDALRFYNRAKTVENAEQQMRSRISTAQAAVIGHTQLSDFVSLDRQRVDKNYSQLFEDLKESVAPKLKEDYGIEVVQVGVRRISLPKETTKQVFESMRQERNKRASDFRQQGKSEAAAIVAQAESEANQIQDFADTLAAEIRSSGVQAATRIMEQIQQQDADFYGWLRMLDTLRNSLSQQATVFIDQQDWAKPLFDTFTKPPVGQTQAQKPAETPAKTPETAAAVGGK